MKALTNILTHMLMLLLMVVLATCTNDDGADEVMPMDDGMVQLKVGMTVPNLKITTRAADEGEKLTSIKGLCYDENGTLTKIADATDISTTTFNMRVPTETRIIHFLANLPNDCTLPKVWTTTEDALKNLTTKSSSMTYWGRTTFNATPADCNITFYRNKARIIIKAADGSSVGTVGIAGVVNAYDTGMLVPYSGTYNFDLLTNDYPTVPTEDFTKGNVMVNTNPLPTQYDVFEHPNTGTSQASSLYAICLIGSKYYKVALGISDEDGMVTDNYFRIIRNHKYVISVADVDDVDASLGANLPNDAVNLAPINDPNIKVEDLEDVVVTLSTSTASLYYDSNNTQEITVTIPEGKTLSQLTITPSVDCFTITSPSGEMTATNSVYTYAPNGGVTGTVVFTIAPKSGYNFTNVSSSTLTFAGTGENMNVSTAQTEVTLTAMPKVTFNYTANQIIQVGNSITVTMNVSNGGTLNALNIAADGFEIKQNNNTIGTNNYSGNNLNYSNIQITYTFVATTTGSKTITFNDAQGTNLNIPSLPVINVTVNATITATPTQQTIYYDGNNTFKVSVNIPRGVSGLNISATNFNVTLNSGSGTLNGNIYSPNDTNGQTAVFTFTYTGAQSESTQTITFNDASNNANVNGASVTVSVKKAETDVPVLVEGENILLLNELPLTLENNNGIVLLKANGNTESGLLESYRTYIEEDVTLKITFTSDGETSPLSFETTWSGALKGEFSLIDSNKYLSYTFDSSDFETGNGGDNTIANAGLRLKVEPNSSASITAISIIIPASTTD